MPLPTHVYALSFSWDSSKRPDVPAQQSHHEPTPGNGSGNRRREYLGASHHGGAALALACLRRGAWLWVGSRLLIAVVFAFAELEPVRLTTLGSLQVVLLTVALAWAEMIVLKERALIGNLGISRAAVAAMCAVPSALGETIIVLAGFTA